MATCAFRCFCVESTARQDTFTTTTSRHQQQQHHHQNERSTCIDTQNTSVFDPADAAAAAAAGESRTTLTLVRIVLPPFHPATLPAHPDLPRFVVRRAQSVVACSTALCDTLPFRLSGPTRNKFNNNGSEQLPVCGCGAVTVARTLVRSLACMPVVDVVLSWVSVCMFKAMLCCGYFC